MSTLRGWATLTVVSSERLNALPGQSNVTLRVLDGIPGEAVLSTEPDMSSQSEQPLMDPGNDNAPVSGVQGEYDVKAGV